MSNRIIKESICASEDIAALSWFEQALFFRLIVLADDNGVTDARVKIILGRGFPFSEVSAKDIESGLERLATLGMITRYEVEGKPYLYLNSWGKHQRIRNRQGKYPLPEGGSTALPQVAASGGEWPQVAASGGEWPPKTKTETESKTKSESQSETQTERAAAASECMCLGKYGNVQLTGDALEKLKSERPGDWQHWIDELDEYIESTGKGYQNHLATIRSWIKRTGADKSGSGPGSFDREEFFQGAIRNARRLFDV